MLEYAPTGSTPVGVIAMGNDVTRSPGATTTPSVPGPSSTTSAQNSWPITKSWCGSNVIGAPSSFADSASRSPNFSAWRSEPQMPHALTATSASPGPGTGSGTSSMRSEVPRAMAARMGRNVAGGSLAAQPLISPERSDPEARNVAGGSLAAQPLISPERSDPEARNVARGSLA